MHIGIIYYNRFFNYLSTNFFYRTQRREVIPPYLHNVPHIMASANIFEIESCLWITIIWRGHISLINV